jgi:acylphosphatase
MARERVRVVYSGRVQGVGFRFTAERLAHQLDVGGWVRNLDDGRVELAVEGEPAETDALLEAIAQEMRGKIHSVESESLPPGNPPLNAFSIRY